MTDKPYIPRLYGRRQDKTLKPRQARLMDELLPALSISIPESGALDPTSIFPDAKQIWMEVGFGGGEHLAWHAARHPEFGIIGAEPFVNGVAKLLSHVDEMNLSNVRIRHGDARPLIEALPDRCLDRLFVLHPDPWPKKRHHKRRFVSPWFFREAARIMKSGGILRIASDIPDYVRWTLMHAQHAPEFTWLAETADDWRVRPRDWPQTRYEAKAIKEGRPPAYLAFSRR